MELKELDWNADSIVLIPAAGGSRDIIGRESNFPAALVRLGNKPIICLSLEHLISEGFRHFRIGITPKYMDNFKNALGRFESEAVIELIASSQEDSAINTLKILAENISAKSSILVNLGDTFCKWNLQEFQQCDVAILIEKVPETERWSTVNISREGEVTDLFEKNSKIGGSFGVCGVYWWRDGIQFLSKLLNLKNDANISDLLRIETLGIVHGVIPDLWCDSDHGDMRENSRHRVIESRSFNEIVIDDFRGILRKRSSNKEKLVLEIEYYKNIPDSLQIFFPRMLGWKISESENYQDLEYYSYPTLSDLYCYEKVPNFVWQRIFEKLSRITFREFASITSGNPEDEQSLSDIFVTKIEARNSNLVREPSAISQILAKSIISINEIEYLGVSQILERSRQILDTHESPWTFVHGDFCLSNILCEPDSNNMKFIDPRGGFVGPSCYGPQLYDVAKLSHSIIGKYDLIISDQFSLDVSKLRYNQTFLKIRESSWHGEIEYEFTKTYLGDKINPALAKLVSGLALLSNPIFHLDKPDRAISMILQGVIISNEAILELA